MNLEEKKKIISVYKERLKEKGEVPEALGWRNKSQQYLRFEVLAGIDDLSEKSVLDVGCGFGDFYSFLLEQGKHVDYVGVDINCELLEVAKKRYPDIRFEERDIIESPMKRKFDYVIESGVLNRKLYNNEEFAQRLLTVMYEHCRSGISANMMSTHVDYTEEILHYYDPSKYFSFCKTLSKYVTLRHDYPLYEFTLYIHRKCNAGAEFHGKKSCA